jgi:type IV pilus biogenesis protein CpaD/CtpE
MITRTIAGIAALLLLQGCSSAPRFEKNFGAAVRANLAAQTINPRGAANTNPATGIDGPAARAAHERYQRSFTQPDSAVSAPLLNTMGNAK